MFIQFSEYDLLELFETEPVLIGEYEAGMCIYSKTDDFGFKLVLTISVYENECLISLNHQSYSVPIVDFKLKDVMKISRNDNRLIIQCDDRKKQLEVLFKPNFSFNEIMIYS